MVNSKRPRRVVGSLVLTRQKRTFEDVVTSYSFKPSIYHALIVIFLEFFSWGLLTTPSINITHKTFPHNTLLFNGLIQGVKGFLSFLSAPLIGAMSDVLGRKPFLLLTVSVTCAPIPFMVVSPWWYFALISISGAMAVTFSVVFAYVADITSEEERSSAYGLVSATFAASLITSPAIGAFLDQAYGQNVVVMIASAIALLDVLFIFAFVPESLPEKLRPSLPWGSHLTWDKADPFGALKKLGHDKLVLLLCLTVLLSYLPEAGEYSSFFVYLKLIIGFSEQEIASYIAFVGVLSVLAQTSMLALLMKYLGSKTCIIIGLSAECVQLFMYGFGSTNLVMWLAGFVAAVSSISYPAISAFVSAQTSPDQQGVAQGVVTGIRGLCNGLGPALFGVVFYMFDVDLSEAINKGKKTQAMTATDLSYLSPDNSTRWMPGPPFFFGGILVICAIFVATYIPNKSHSRSKDYKSIKDEELSPRRRHDSLTTLDLTLQPQKLKNSQETKLLIPEDDDTDQQST